MPLLVVIAIVGACQDYGWKGGVSVVALLLGASLLREWAS